MGNMSIARQHGELVGSGESLQQYIEKQIAAGGMPGNDEFATLGLHLAARLRHAGERSGGLVGPVVFVHEYYRFMADCAARDQKVEVADLPENVADIPAATRGFFGHDLVHKMVRGAFGEEFADYLIENASDMALTPIERARLARLEQEQAAEY